MKSYFNCKHPVRVFNKYLNEYVYVPCRKCSMCENIKSFQWQNRVAEEFKFHSHALFITLKYDNEHLPLSRPYYRICRFSNGVNSYDSLDCNTFYYAPRTHRSPVPISCVESYPRPVRLVGNNRAFGVVSVSDVQLFVKRLRKKIHYYKFKFNIQNEKIRYYIISEYGPSTLRPHYHGIIWFDDGNLSKVFGNFVSSCWSLGSSSCKRANAGTSKYVAKYTNSFNKFTKVFENKSFRPFRLSSKCPAIGFSENDKETAKEIFYGAALERVKFDVDSRTNVVDVSAVSVARRFFPKCTGYCSLSLDAVKSVMSYVYSWRDRNVKVCASEIEIQFPVDYTPLDIHCSYMCDFWCRELNITPQIYYMMFEKLWSRIELLKLKNQYMLQSEMCSKYGDISVVNSYPELLRTLPLYYSDLKYNVPLLEELEMFHLDIGKLYPKPVNHCSVRVLDHSYVDSISWRSYGETQMLFQLHDKIRVDSTKSKIKNDYYASRYFLKEFPGGTNIVANNLNWRVRRNIKV